MSGTARSSASRTDVLQLGRPLQARTPWQQGGTLIISGSHKSNLPHPQAEEFRHERMDTMVGAVQPELRKGDALLFCDALAHGAASRTNPGERRVAIYRYGPSWGSTRNGIGTPRSCWPG